MEYSSASSGRSLHWHQPAARRRSAGDQAGLHALELGAQYVPGQAMGAVPLSPPVQRHQQQVRDARPAPRDQERATFNRDSLPALPAAGEEILRARSDDGVVTSEQDIRDHSDS